MMSYTDTITNLIKENTEQAMQPPDAGDDLLAELKAMKISVDRAIDYATKMRSSTYKLPLPGWLPLNDMHISGEWWRCPLARQMLTLTNTKGEKWGGKGMRDPENTLMWVENMAVGQEDEYGLPQGANNFWATAKVHFANWKKRNGLE